MGGGAGEGGLGKEGPGGKEGDGPLLHLPPHPLPSRPRPSVPPLGMWGRVRARKSEPPLTPATGPEPPHPHPAFCGQLPVARVGRGTGAIALCILEKPLGEEGDPDSPLAPALRPSSWLSLSKCASEGPLPQTLAPASDSQAALPAHRLGQRPHTCGCSSHENQ